MRTPPYPLPIQQELGLAYRLSLGVALLVTVASAAGLLFPSAMYPTAELAQAFLVNDAVNLMLGLPILLGSLWLARRGQWAGLLCWPGALLYGIYNYLAYLFSRAFAWITVVNLAIVLLSAYALFDLLKKIDRRLVQERLAGKVPEKLAGWVLAVFGMLFFFRAVGAIAASSAGQAGLPLADFGVLMADLVVSALWTGGGALLLRRRPLGYAGALGLLFAASTLFIGLILFLLLQPLLTEAPFAWVDALVVCGMGLVCFIPCGLFLRGVIAQQRASPRLGQSA
jgi:hypothetical protein